MNGPPDAEAGTRRTLELRRSESLESVARVVGRVAHDVNNLLSVILTYAEFLDGSITDATAREDLEQIVLAARRGAELNSRLLSFSRRAGSATASADVNLAVTAAATVAGPMLNPGVVLETELGDGLPRACCDQHELEQLVGHLVANANEAMPDGGHLTLTTARRQGLPDAMTQDPGSGASAAVTISVHDTGAGIDREIWPIIFEPFATTKPKGQGTGLGLAVVYGAVVRCGGAVEVSSRADRGTVFTLVFPVAD